MPTDYARWKSAKAPYCVEYQKLYEPYVVLRKLPGLPRYN